MQHFPGLMTERLPSGATRYRVRAEKEPRTKITLSVGPEHYDFSRQYHDARAGHSSRHSGVKRLMETGNILAHVRSMMGGMAYRAKQRGLAVTLTEEDLIGMLEAQGARCAVSGIEFDLRPLVKGRRPFAPSADRIDNARGYSVGNVRLTCAIINTALADWPLDDFRKMCAAVVARP